MSQRGLLTITHFLKTTKGVRTKMPEIPSGLRDGEQNRVLKEVTQYFRFPPVLPKAVSCASALDVTGAESLLTAPRRRTISLPPPSPPDAQPRALGESSARGSGRSTFLSALGNQPCAHQALSGEIWKHSPCCPTVTISHPTVTISSYQGADATGRLFK